MKQPIIIQGAMEMEVCELLKMVNIEKEQIFCDTKFYEGKLDNYPVVISETQVGVINASIATFLAIEKYNPCAIINQGIAGSHVPNIHKYDIIIGEKCVNINSFITGVKNKTEGSNPMEWLFDQRSIEYHCNQRLLESAKSMTFPNTNIFFGTIGSGDIFNREVDRIEWIHKKKNTLCEDNESIALYNICDRFNIPCIGIRTITNNEITQTESDGSTVTRLDLNKNSNRIISQKHDLTPAKQSQQFVIEYIKKLIHSIN